jgi:hypothetical protein
MDSIGTSRRQADFQPSLAFVVVVEVAADGNPHYKQNISGKLKIIIRIFLFSFFFFGILLFLIGFRILSNFLKHIDNK